MRKHWNPQDELALGREPRAKARWPEGATAGLVMLGAGCFAIGMILYRLAGPRDVFTP
jgi:hypothetical protein